jgi:hypothetical protein
LFRSGKVFLFSSYGLKRRKRRIEVEIEKVDSLDDLFTGFWRKASTLYPILGIRDQNYLKWRYFRHPTRNYLIYRAKKNGEMRGYIVLRKADLLRFNSAVIVDLLTLDEAAFAALVEKGIDRCREEGADLLGFMVPQNHPYDKLMRKKGFLPSPKTFQFMIYLHSEREIFLSPDKWYVNWGDTDVI